MGLSANHNQQLILSTVDQDNDKGTIIAAPDEENKGAEVIIPAGILAAGDSITIKCSFFTNNRADSIYNIRVGNSENFLDNTLILKANYESIADQIELFVVDTETIKKPGGLRETAYTSPFGQLPVEFNISLSENIYITSSESSASDTDDAEHDHIALTVEANK